MAKKDYGDDPFSKADEATPDVSEALFGKVAVPESGRETVKPIDIMAIYPDSSQPRRAIPMAYRKGWAGQPNKIPDLLKKWKASIEQRLGATVTTKELILGADFPALPEGVDGDIQDYFDLVSLANSIYKEGLTNPIATVMISPDSYLLVAGERRFLAFHLLNLCQVPNVKSKIPCRILPKKDVWAQASENGARKPLNAIGMARQLALLILDMYQGEDGLQGIEEYIKNERPDREYYAQVANGNVWRIKKGMGQRILDVTGLKSAEAIADYRKVLSINDAIWEQADAENWTLNRIQSVMGWVAPKKDTLEISNVSAPTRYQDTSEISDISEASRYQNTSVIADVSGQRQEPIVMQRPSFAPPVDDRPRSFELKVPVGNPEVVMPPKPAPLDVQVMNTVVNDNGVQMIVRSKVGLGVWVARTALETRDRWVMWEWGTFSKVDTQGSYRPMTQAEKDMVLGNMMGDEPQAQPMPQAPQPQRFGSDYSKAALLPEYLERIMARFAIFPDVSNEFRVAVDFLETVSDAELVRLSQENALTHKAETSYNAIANQLELILKGIEEFLHQLVARANELD